MSDFVMTYPALFLLNEHDAPEIVEIDGKLCVWLFTDVDLAQSFDRDKHGKSDEHSQVFAPHDRNELLHILKDWPHIAVLAEHDIARLQVAMQNAFAVCKVDGIADVEEPLQELAKFECSLPLVFPFSLGIVEALNGVFEAVPLNELHRVVRTTIGVRTVSQATNAVARKVQYYG